MNKYYSFFSNLKEYLVKYGFQKESDFSMVTEEEINDLQKKIRKPIPLVYKEWLKVFGRTNCLLNFPIEDYTIEELEYCQEQDESLREYKEEKRELLLVTQFENLFIYLVVPEDNSTTYTVNLNNPMFKEELQHSFKFTTHIKELIIHLINNLIATNEQSTELKVWFEQDILNREVRPWKKKNSYINFLRQIEEAEFKENRIYSLDECAEWWNQINREAKSGI